MHKHLILRPLLFVAWLSCCATFAHAAAPADEPPTIVREIFVPFESRETLLENQPRRVLLSRGEYEDLLKKAKKSMTEAGGPVVPGSEGTVEDITAARALSAEIGYPMIVKASAGGGGWGMCQL